MRTSTTTSTPPQKPRGPRRAAVLTALATVTLMVLVAVPSGALHGGGIAAEPLTGRHQFTDDLSAQLRLKADGRPTDVLNLHDASNLAVVEITIGPGDTFPWHTHPSPVLAAVTQGDLVYVYADDCVERPYPEGTAFVDPGGDNVHTAYNPGEEDAIVIATFLGTPDEGPLTIPVDAARQDRLDEQCPVG